MTTSQKPLQSELPFTPWNATTPADYLRHARNLHGLGDAKRHQLSDAIQNFGQNYSKMAELIPLMTSPTLSQAYQNYLVDFYQRWFLFLDAMRLRSIDFLAHEQGATDTVLKFDYKVIIDGATLERPVNYSLIRIVAPQGMEQREEERPYIIIDPRAGHGSGIGGFKQESEVGCALKAGNPVYFVIFSRLPQPNQTLADVCAAEAHFVREVQRLHPNSPKPIIVGNCQGGWATMLLAATNPDITGPVVANGSPLSYWSGRKGDGAMRYLGGLVGGEALVMLLSDLSNGHFDGAHLVMNFEYANPARTWWQKYYDLFDRIDTEFERFLEFERWWGSYYFMTESEIRWIIDNLFVGNRLARGQANLDERTHVDLRNIQSPIIIFASHGDNITPPQQALGWIADHYKDVEEIKARGQRILYTLHDSIGHLGIFVSSTIAKRQHTEIISTLKAIEALAPGLYEMTITEEIGEGINKQFQVAFDERQIDQMMEQAGGVDDVAPFATVARFSHLSGELYDLTLRPMIKSLVTEQSAEFVNQWHPLRVKRYVTSQFNPWMESVPALAQAAREQRQPVDIDNPFRRFERLWAQTITQSWEVVRIMQNHWIESTFHWLYDSPPGQKLGQQHSRRISDLPQEDLRALTTVQAALDRMEQGGFAEGILRMLILLAHARGSIRRSRLARSNQVLEQTPPFNQMNPKHRTRMIHRQSLIVAFEHDAALKTLPKLLPSPEERRHALEVCWQIAGPEEEMNEATLAMMNRFRELLEVTPDSQAVSDA